jgi:hypothetical protein
MVASLSPRAMPFQSCLAGSSRDGIESVAIGRRAHTPFPWVTPKTFLDAHRYGM